MTLLIILTLLMFKVMRSLRSAKCLKTTAELTFTTQEANALSPLTNSNMQNSMAMFTFSVLDQKNPFWTNLAKKNQNSVKAEIWYQETNLNMRNSVTMFFF